MRKELGLPLPLLITRHSSLITPLNPFREVFDGALEPFAQGHGRLPAEELARARDVRASLLRVVLRERAEARARLPPDRARDLLGQLPHRELAGVPDVDGVVNVVLFRRTLLDVHQTHHALDQVVNVAETTRLLARPVDGQLLAPQRLHDEVRHHAPVVLKHAGAVRVEDAYDSRVNAVLPVVV